MTTTDFALIDRTVGARIAQLRDEALAAIELSSEEADVMDKELDAQHERTAVQISRFSAVVDLGHRRKTLPV
jgi:hypothetical protein